MMISPWVLVCVFGISLGSAGLVEQEKIIESHGLKSEKYEVQTEDGYVLTLYRIPGKDNKAIPVLLVHGFMASSEVFSLFNYSLSYKLHENGNDVWLGNLRGNVHSRRHIKLKPSEENFWKFSYQEHGKYDLPAMIDFVIAKTKKPYLHYIGHSMGTTVFFIMGSERPKHTEKVNKFIALSPIGSCKKYTFMLSTGSVMHDLVMETTNGLMEKHKWEAFPRMDVGKTEHQILCPDLPDDVSPYCVMGVDMTKSIIGDYLPAGSSLKTIKHFLQCYSTGNLSHFDMGKETNMKVYMAEYPPKYTFKNIKSSVYLIYAESDQAINQEDVDETAADIPNAEKIKIDNEDFTHVDYIVLTNEESEKDYHKLVTKIKELVKK